MTINIYGFGDYYDHWFSFNNKAIRFIRRSDHHKISREQMFEFFIKHSLRVPLYGVVEELKTKIIERRHHREHRFVGDISHMVVHNRSYSTQGMDKQLLALGDDLRPFYGKFATEYIPSTINGSRTERMLRIGKNIFWLEYRSNDWRSNVGDVEIKFLREDRPIKIGSLPIDQFAPITAIDFVKCGNFSYAIDLNTAPAISKTGIENVIQGKQIYREIEEWFLWIDRSVHI